MPRFYKTGMGLVRSPSNHSLHVSFGRMDQQPIVIGSFGGSLGHSGFLLRPSRSNHHGTAKETIAIVSIVILDPMKIINASTGTVTIAAKSIGITAFLIASYYLVNVLVVWAEVMRKSGTE